MHTVIDCLVPAKSAEEALAKGKTVFEELCGDGRQFDYYTTFDDDSSPMSGPGRWGKQAPAQPISHPAGMKLMDGAMAATKREFLDNLKEVRAALSKYKDLILFNGVGGFDASMFRYRLRCMGRTSGPDIWLYDQHGEGIINEPDLKRSLEAMTKDLAAGEEIWIVPADVHF